MSICLLFTLTLLGGSHKSAFHDFQESEVKELWETDSFKQTASFAWFT